MTIIYRKLYNKRNHTYENIVILTIKKAQKANHTLGAQITWQVSGSNTVYYASRASGTGASVTSKSKNLKGKSFGYYYVDGKLKHESTAWMNFKF